jgi:CHAT domain-containing protein
MAQPAAGSALDPAANEAVYLAVQRTIEGVVFVARDRAGVHPYQGGDEWNEAVRSMLFLLESDLRNFAPAEAIAARGQRLWQALPPEVQALLGDGRPVYLSPDDLTANLPFELLNPTGAPDDWLGLRHVLSRTPGLARYAQALGELQLHTDARPNVILFGNPTHEGAADLPGSEKEAGSVQGKLRLQSRLTLDVACYLRTEATSVRFLAGLDADPWVIHFTGHGGFGGGEPYLCFAGKGMLAARGLPNRPLNGHPLVVLNCCLAGQTTPTGGWYRGLVDGFLSRGAAAVLASSFPVLDFPSMHFSAAFYERLLQDGVTVGEAILHARRTVAAMPGSHPLWWGLFAPWGNVNARLALP